MPTAEPAIQCEINEPAMIDCLQYTPPNESPLFRILHSSIGIHKIPQGPLFVIRIIANWLTGNMEILRNIVKIYRNPLFDCRIRKPPSGEFNMLLLQNNIIPEILLGAAEIRFSGTANKLVQFRL